MGGREEGRGEVEEGRMSGGGEVKEKGQCKASHD